jgi:serine/threonine protein kinase
MSTADRQCSHAPEYRITGVAGSGAFATVYRAVCTDLAFAVERYDAAPPDEDDDSPPREAAPCYVAIKQIIDYSCQNRIFTFAHVQRTHYLRMVCREIEILHHFRGVPQIIHIGDVYMSSDEHDVYIGMPYIERNLRDLIEKKCTVCATPNEEGPEAISEPATRWIVLQILLALDVIHGSGVIHRDLTLTNVLVNGAGDTFVADFGLSRAAFTTNRDVTLDVVTLPYRAPELLLEFHDYTTAVDIWSLGCITAELLLGKPFLYLTGKNPDSVRQLRMIFEKVTGLPPLDEVEGASERGVGLVRYRHAKEAGRGCAAPGPTDIADYFKLPEGTAVPSTADPSTADPSTADPSTAVRSTAVPSTADASTAVPSAGCRVSEDCLNVLRRMFVFLPRDRATAKELLSMPWFASDAGCQLAIAATAAAELPPPGAFTEYVEDLDVAQLVELITRRADGRRATIDSTLQVAQKPKKCCCCMYWKETHREN